MRDRSGNIAAGICAAGLALAGALLLSGCPGSGSREAADPPLSLRPNVLWIVWDTVRADHLDLYGYPRSTAPFLTQWSKDARVFEDALSPAGYTLPAHASMFTGLYPSEHCTHNDNARLDDSYTTIAELLKGAGATGSTRSCSRTAPPSTSSSASTSGGAMESPRAPAPR